ncbi:hypothetical protein [Mesorhizobium sp.]|uniref:hypothetical protein n=1 Tax=Mesorhizobium sp. TaxID=1871066 RepID=UPI0025C3A130|nr:hypothetical protein [Mesorhizobium sp.]
MALLKRVQQRQAWSIAAKNRCKLRFLCDFSGFGSIASALTAIIPINRSITDIGNL